MKHDSNPLPFAHRITERNPFRDTYSHTYRVVRAESDPLDLPHRYARAYADVYLLGRDTVHRVSGPRYVRSVLYRACARAAAARRARGRVSSSSVML